MSAIFFIEDRFNITGRGTVYSGKIFPRNACLRLGDFLYDSAGNAFEIKGIEMFRRILIDYDDSFDYPVGFLLKNEEGLQVQGDIMTDGSFEFNYLFCNHPLYQRKPDEDYEIEYIAAQDNGNKVALFSYEDMEQGKLSLYGDEIKGLTIYRGWMMKPEMYRAFYEQCKKKDIILINDPTRYKECHLLPSWYDKVFPNTARSVWTEGGDIEKAIAMLDDFDSDVIVKDYVKSRKHEWYEACFVSNNSCGEKVIKTFVERQGENLVGGIVLREFLKLKKAGYHNQSGMPISEEYRVVVALGKVVSVTAYWEGQTEDRIDKIGEFALECTRKIRSNFYTVDVAVKTNGDLVVMEVGDGQVSGLQEETAEKYYEKIGKSFDITANCSAE